MATFSFTGYKTIVIKQGFDIEASTKEEAMAKLLEMEDDGDLNGEWFDFDTANIESPESPDFYDEDDELVEV